MGAGYHTLHHTTYRDNYGAFQPHRRRRDPAPPSFPVASARQARRRFRCNVSKQRNASSPYLRPRPIRAHSSAASRPADWIAGQFFVFFDWVHETLLPPEHMAASWEKWGVPNKRKAKGEVKAE